MGTTTKERNMVCPTCNREFAAGLCPQCFPVRLPIGSKRSPRMWLFVLVPVALVLPVVFAVVVYKVTYAVQIKEAIPPVPTIRETEEQRLRSLQPEYDKLPEEPKLFVRVYREAFRNLDMTHDLRSMASIYRQHKNMFNAADVEQFAEEVCKRKGYDKVADALELDMLRRAVFFTVTFSMMDDEGADFIRVVERAKEKGLYNVTESERLLLMKFKTAGR